MYTTCIFCHEPLGANETIEHFPIGRRLAFDSAKGRLWVVCRNCAQWNLTPLEERWEAVEACERAYRSVRTRVSTPEIGLARLAEGLDLVRIGAPLRPEFAAWRFGDEFSRRRRRAIQVGVVGTGLVAGAGITFGFGLAAAGVAGPLVGYGAMWMLGAARAVVGKWTSRFPHPLDLTADDGSRVRFGRQYSRDILMRTDHSPHGFHLAMDVGGEEGASGLPIHHATVSGEGAVRAARLLLPRINGSGATKRTVSSAVKVIEEVGTTERFIPHALSIVRKAGLAYSSISAYPTPVRLAMEMSLHEEVEQRALEGELAELVTAWREAERVAGIADDLLLPPHVAVFLDKHRKR